jgi:hypothetical protein
VKCVILVAFWNVVLGHLFSFYVCVSVDNRTVFGPLAYLTSLITPARSADKLRRLAGLNGRTPGAGLPL